MKAKIKNMLYINFITEACGEDGGGIYFLNDGENIDTITISSIAMAVFTGSMKN